MGTAAPAQTALNSGGGAEFPSISQEAICVWCVDPAGFLEARRVGYR